MYFNIRWCDGLNRFAAILTTTIADEFDLNSDFALTNDICQPDQIKISNLEGCN